MVYTLLRVSRPHKLYARIRDFDDFNKALLWAQDNMSPNLTVAIVLYPSGKPVTPVVDLLITGMDGGTVEATDPDTGESIMCDLKQGGYIDMSACSQVPLEQMPEEAITSDYETDDDSDC